MIVHQSKSNSLETMTESKQMSLLYEFYSTLMTMHFQLLTLCAMILYRVGNQVVKIHSPDIHDAYHTGADSINTRGS